MGEERTFEKIYDSQGVISYLQNYQLSPKSMRQKKPSLTGLLAKNSIAEQIRYIKYTYKTHNAYFMGINFNNIIKFRDLNVIIN